MSNELPKGFLEELHGEFAWYPKLGLGHINCPKETDPYLTDPWALEKFQEYENLLHTKMGMALNKFRARLVYDFAPMTSEVVDVGIGAGAFIRECIGVRGYDVNPHGVRWLKERELFWDVYEKGARCVTLWDVFEHLEEPVRLLSMVKKWVFMSLPTFSGMMEVLQSKHYKPKEHRWYFTNSGLVKLMRNAGFELVFSSNGETVIGRQGIRSYVFRRIGR